MKISQIVVVPLFLFTIFAVKAADKIEANLVPWQVGSKTGDGFCSKMGDPCYRIFLGVTDDNKLLVQDFYSDQSAHQNSQQELIESQNIPLTDPYQLLTIDDVKYNLFYVSDGRDGFYRCYDFDGSLNKEGEYIAGKKNGLWLSMTDKDKFYGNYLNNEKDGIWIDIISNNIYMSSYQQGLEQQTNRLSTDELIQYNQQLLQSLLTKPTEYQRFSNFLITKNTRRSEHLLPCEKEQVECYKELYSIGDDLIVIEWMTNHLSPKLGLIDKQRQLIVEPKYDQLSAQNGYIKVAVYGDSYENRYSEGILDLKGQEIIAVKRYYNVEFNPEYRMAIVQNFDDNDVRNYGVIDIDGNEILPIKYRAVYFDHHILHFNTYFQNGNHIYSGFYNIKTRQYIQPNYDNIDLFYNGTAEISKQIGQGYKFGLIDDSGYEVVSPTYDAMYFDKTKQLAEVRQNNLVGIIDRKGLVIVPIIFDRFIDNRLETWRGDLIIGQNSQGYAVYNYRTGKLLLPLAHYDHVWHDGRGFNYRQKNQTYYYDENGQLITSKAIH